MLLDGRCHLDQPSAIFGNFLEVRRGKILDAIRCGIAKGLEQAGMDQRRNVVRLAVQQPAGLLRREADWQLAQEGQKPVLIFFHTQHRSRIAPESEQILLSGLDVPQFNQAAVFPLPH